ncbi:MAG: sodium:proton antiporter [Gammaproteobacteria bacterium]|nr:MAG: sodium:proton antiporter [Gammaproteobacteria bacterium]
MAIPSTIIFFVTLVALTALSRPLSAWLRVPVGAVQIVFGFVAVMIVTQRMGLDTGLRASSFHDLVVFVLLPVVLFQAAYGLTTRDLVKDLGGALLLALIGLLLTTAVCSVLVYYGIGHPTGFPWAAALLTGALLSATDPSAVTQTLREHGAAPRIVRLLEGESLYSDALAIVLFSTALALALMPDSTMSAPLMIGAFASNLFTGLLIGIPSALALTLLLRGTKDSVLRTGSGIALAYGTYLTTELMFDASGAMAALATGLLLGRADRAADTYTGEFWKLSSFLASGALFLLMGATITVAMFEQRWLAMLIAIGAALIARALVVCASFTLLRPFSANPVGLADQATLIWGGTRGAVTLALALSLPVSLDYWWTIQSMAFGVVLFGVLFQAPTLMLFARQHDFGRSP